MRNKLILLAFALIPYLALGQIINAGEKIDGSKVKPWNPKKTRDYQAEYQFGSPASGSTFVLVVSNDSCFAQIKSAKVINKGKEPVWNYENLKNVKIKGDKFYSNKTNGEFTRFRNKKGLVIYKPWQGTFKKGESEIGFVKSKLKKHFPGKYSYASRRELTQNELINMKLADLRIMRNEIYARYGLIFKSRGDLDTFFRAKRWYQPQHTDVSSFLTGLEKLNIDMIQMVEEK